MCESDSCVRALCDGPFISICYIWFMPQASISLCFCTQTFPFKMRSIHPYSLVMYRKQPLWEILEYGSIWWESIQPWQTMSYLGQGSPGVRLASVAKLVGVGKRALPTTAELWSQEAVMLCGTLQCFFSNADTSWFKQNNKLLMKYALKCPPFWSCQ